MISKNAVKARFICNEKTYFIKIMLPFQPFIVIPVIPGSNVVFPVPPGKYRRLFIVLMPDADTFVVEQVVYKKIT